MKTLKAWGGDLWGCMQNPIHRKRVESDTNIFQTCSAVFSKKCHLSILGTHKYSIIDERPKWACHTFLEKWLNRFGNFWYQIESMNVLRVNYGLDFAFSPRGPCPSPFMHVQKSAAIWR